MRKPQQPPLFESLLEDADTLHLAVVYLKRAVPSTGIVTYLHWDDLRRRTPPPGLTHEAWWLALKLARKANYRVVDLLDNSHRPFQISLPPEAIEKLHEIDGAGGLRSGTGVAPPTASPYPANRYLVTSLLEESITSSQLEGAVTTRQVAKEMLASGRRPRDESERMILNNYRTMQCIVELKAEPMSPEVVFRIHKLVTAGTLANPAAAGRLRREEEAIELGDQYGETFHQPPPATELAARLRQMCAFANDQGQATAFHPVVRAVLLHFWLAYDHPFVDGNGRTARALFYWAMLHHGYGLFEYISISTILRNAPVQYDRSFLLTESDDNDLTYFLMAQLDVIHRAIAELESYAERKAQEMAATAERLGALEAFLPRQVALLQQALKNPRVVFTIQGHQNITGVAYQTARTDLLDLVAKGLLVQVKRGKQFVFKPVPNLAEVLEQLGV